jgi:hypothetical protein
MAINFGPGTTTEDEESVNDILDKAMANLQKFAAPILKEAQKHPSKTTTTETYDPAKGEELKAKLMADVPSSGEILLGGLSGAFQGYLAGGNMSTSTENPGGSGVAKSVGAAVGGLLGSTAYGGGRRAGASGQEALGSITAVSGLYKQNQQQKMAEDAVGSAVQQFGELNNPGNNPKTAAMNAAERERITSTLAQNLVASGLAPDKAIQTAANVASINAPNSEFMQEPGIQAQRALADYNASAKSPEDKQKLKDSLNGIIMAQAIKTGKMPANANALLFGSAGGGGPSGQPAGRVSSSGGGTTVQAVDPETGEPLGPEVGVGEAAAAGGQGGGEAIDPNYLSKESVRGHQQAASAVDILNQMISKLDEGSDALPDGSIEGQEYKLYDEGLSANEGSAIGAAVGAAGAAGTALFSGGLGLAGTGGMIGAGATMGRGLEGKGAGVQLPGLSDKEVQGAQQMQAMSQALQSAIAKATDPLTGVNRYEGLQWQRLLYDPNKSLEANRTSLTTLRDLMTKREEQYQQEASSNKASNRPGGNLPKGGNVTAKKAKPGLFFFN